MSEVKTVNRRSSVLTRKEIDILKAFAILGAACFSMGLFWNSQRAWANLLLGNFYFISLSLAAAVLIAIQYVSSAGWPTLFRRLPESMTSYLPVGAAIVGLLFFGIHALYPWADRATVVHDPVLRGKALLFNIPNFRARSIAYLALWYFLIRQILKNSKAQDENGGIQYTSRNVGLSAAFLVIFAFTFSLAAIDWILSLEPHWYSTIFPWYIFVGVFVHGISVQTMLLILLRKRGFFAEVNSHHLHDLGKFMFAFSFFWAYLWFSQYLLIWYSNIPEETVYFVARTHYPWNLLFWGNPVINFVIPAALLLSVRRKKNARILFAAGAVLVIGHWLDLYLMIMPSIQGMSARMGWLEAGIFMGLAAVYILLFGRAFSTAPSVPAGDPYLGESLHHHS